MIDGKKSWAIKHWYEATGPEALEEVSIALKDAPFQHGPWGEPLSMMRLLFVGSAANLSASPESEAMPALEEASITIDWSLTLTEAAQGMLFRRVRLQFDRATAIVDEVSDRKKYRMSEDDLTTLRNIMALWDQIQVFCSTRVPGFDQLDAALRNNSHRDSDIRELLDERPQVFAVSMLASAKEAAMKELKKQEEVATLEVEQQKIEVREARWKFFTCALEKDQNTLLQIDAAPSKLEAVRHRKAMAWKMEQAKNGEKIIKSYLNKFLRSEIVEKVEHAQQLVNEYRTFVAT